MLYITAMIKTDFHTYFYRTIVLKKGTGNPLLDTNVLQDEWVKDKGEKNAGSLVPSILKRGSDVRDFNDF